MTAPHWSFSLNGAFLLDKPEDLSSTGALNRLKGMLRSYGIRSKKLPKIGHGGTLDPFATGLLVVLVGHGTSLASHRLKEDKQYGGVMVFGEKTPSGDPETDVCERGPVPSIEEIKRMSKEMEGPYLQVPPMYSAKKVDGKRLYEYARKGKEVSRDPVPCFLDNFEVSLGGKPNEFNFQVACSSGTFMRTLAEDLAKRLGTVAHLRSLDRLGSGLHHKSQALSLDDFQRMADEKADWTKSTAFIGMEELLQDWPSCRVKKINEEYLLQGRLEVLQDLLADRKEEKMALFGEGGPIGLAHFQDGAWAFLRMFHSST